MASAAASENPGQSYLDHHLTNLVFGQSSDGHWGFAHNAEEIKEMGFWAINVDTIFFSFPLLPFCSGSFKPTAVGYCLL